MYLPRLQLEQFRTDLSAWDGDWMKIHLADNNAWSDGNEYIMGTASEVHTNALFDIYPNDTTITAEFKGNTQQNGTPSPSAPVPVVGVGYLDGTAYKIPVEIGLSTQSIDLSAVQSVRNIKKYTFDGTEIGAVYTGRSRDGITFYNINGVVGGSGDTIIAAYCTHFEPYTRTTLYAGTMDGFSNAYQDNQINLFYSECQTVEDFQTWLATQYANGTPVTIYYVLAEPVTDVVNEPLQKIGDYADSISNITLTTTAGATSFGIVTAVKPSEITLNFRGWHPKDPKESTGGEWG